MKNIAVLGSTGSIGRNTLEVIAKHPDRFRVMTLSSGRNLKLLAKQIQQFSPEIVSVADVNDLPVLSSYLTDPKPKMVAGIEGIVKAATHPAVDVVVSAMVGAVGLIPTWEAICAGKTIALANKETLVCAGSLMMEAARKRNVQILPVDSEHSAIFQCLVGHQKESVSRILLTASGGPFRTWTKEQMATISPKQALAHPTWDMGPKITIDSSTMMNKGLEVIEARWLFDMPPSRIKVLVHPESIIHSMVEFQDGQIIAQLSVPDMKGPIAYALSYPERLPSVVDELSLTDVKTLHFEEPNLERFACLTLAYKALEIGGTTPAIMNAANEVAVAAFLEEKILYTDIVEVINSVMNMIDPIPVDSIDTVLKADSKARKTAAMCIEKKEGI